MRKGLALSLPKGFTLIELLVVIAVLGVLAGGVLVAINPLKRINQARDSQIKSDIGQIAQAAQSYFTFNQSYPISIDKLKTSGDLKTEPKAPGGGSYSIVVAPAGCAGTSTNPCTNMAVFAPINDAKATGNVWCWRSADSSSSELASSVCQSSLDETNMFVVGNLFATLGNFETNLSGWSVSNGSVNISQSSDAQVGLKSMRFASTGAGAPYLSALYSSPVTTISNATYTVSAWAKAANTTGNNNVYMVVYGPGFDGSPGQVAIPTNGQWTQFSLNVKSSYTSLGILFRYYDPVTRPIDILIDGIQFQQQ